MVAVSPKALATSAARDGGVPTSGVVSAARNLGINVSSGKGAAGNLQSVGRGSGKHNARPGAPHGCNGSCKVGAWDHALSGPGHSSAHLKQAGSAGSTLEIFRFCFCFEFLLLAELKTKIKKRREAMRLFLRVSLRKLWLRFLVVVCGDCAPSFPCDCGSDAVLFFFF